jgi:hypothetical protein
MMYASKSAAGFCCRIEGYTRQVKNKQLQTIIIKGQPILCHYVCMAWVLSQQYAGVLYNVTLLQQLLNSEVVMQAHDEI